MTAESRERWLISAVASMKQDATVVGDDDDDDCDDVIEMMCDEAVQD